jgi:hypothetical protein
VRALLDPLAAFADKPPLFIKVDLYNYDFSRAAWGRNRTSVRGGPLAALQPADGTREGATGGARVPLAAAHAHLVARCGSQAARLQGWRTCADVCMPARGCHVCLSGRERLVLPAAAGGQKWWVRKKVREWLPAVKSDDPHLRGVLKQEFNWGTGEAEGSAALEGLTGWRAELLRLHGAVWAWGQRHPVEAVWAALALALALIAAQALLLVDSVALAVQSKIKID